MLLLLVLLLEEEEVSALPVELSDGEGVCWRVVVMTLVGPPCHLVLLPEKGQPPLPEDDELLLLLLLLEASGDTEEDRGLQTKRPLRYEPWSGWCWDSRMM